MSQTNNEDWKIMVRMLSGKGVPATFGTARQDPSKPSSMARCECGGAASWSRYARSKMNICTPCATGADSAQKRKYDERVSKFAAEYAELVG